MFTENSQKVYRYFYDLSKNQYVEFSLKIKLHYVGILITVKEIKLITENSVYNFFVTVLLLKSSRIKRSKQELRGEGTVRLPLMFTTRREM